MEMKKLLNFKKVLVVRIEENEMPLLSFNGGIFQLNEVSLEILMKMDEGKQKPEIVDYIATELINRYDDLDTCIQNIREIDVETMNIDFRLF